MTIAPSDDVQPLEPSSVVDDPPHPPPADYHYARFGSFMLAGSNNMSTRKCEIFQDVHKALQEDNRVSAIESTVLREEWTHTYTIYPKLKNHPHSITLLGGQDRLTGIRFSDPLVFTVTVPIKNQPKFRGCDDLPTDTYYVAWDGVTAIVAWPTQPGTQPPRSGGHVVIELLEAVASKVNLRLYAQACSPGCTNLFAHRIMLVARHRGEGPVYTKAAPFPITLVHLHAEDAPRDTPKALLSEMAYAAERFAWFKNSAQRILDIEKLSRSLVEQLLAINFNKIQESKLPFWQRMKGKWANRESSREARSLIASLWLSLASLEALRRDWLDYRRRLLSTIEEHRLEGLFDVDLGDDDAAITSQDLSFIRAAVEQTSIRFDTRLLALATLFGAVGALIGAIIGGILS